MSVGTLVTISTCVRPGADYLIRTAAALMREGASAHARLVLVDGELPEVMPPGWDFETRWPRAGPRVMLWWAFERAIAAGVERLIYCEDDITPVRNAVRYFQRLQVPESAALVSFHAGELDGQERAPGLYRLNMSSAFWGNQCLLIPRRTFTWLATRDPVSVFPEQRRGNVYTGSDLVLGHFLATSPWPQYVVQMPRLVRHDGDVSAAHPDKAPRCTLAFPGEDFDALSLLT
jgi:hypothetical protein